MHALRLAARTDGGVHDTFARLAVHLAGKQVRRVLAEEVEDLREPPAQAVRGREDADGAPQLACGVGEVAQLGGAGGVRDGMGRGSDSGSSAPPCRGS